MQAIELRRRLHQHGCLKPTRELYLSQSRLAIVPFLPDDVERVVG
jgi:hypothetical protein